MNSQAAIEHHHDVQESRAEVYLTDLRIGFDFASENFDRAVMLDVERGGVRSDQSRPRKDK